MLEDNSVLRLSLVIIIRRYQEHTQQQKTQKLLRRV